MPEVTLGKLLRPIERPEPVDPSRMYRLLGIRWYGEGLFEKESRMGQEIQAQRLYKVHEGDFVYNRLFAWKGSFAVADKKVHGCYVSNEFPCFRADDERLDVGFLRWWFHQELAWSKALGLSQGATPTSRNRLKEELFLAMKIPLPPLDVQRRVVALIERLVGQIDEANSLRRQAIEEGEVLCRSILSHDPQSRLTPMRDLVRLRPPDVAVRREETYQFAGVYCFGRGVFLGNKKSGSDFAYPRLTRLHAGDFVYPKLMAWEGALGVVPPECDQCVVSTEFPVFEIRQELVYPEVLDTLFRNPAVWPELAGASTGTNVRRRRLNPEDFLNFCILLPTRDTQERLRKVRAELRVMSRFQMETSAQLDAMLPAILDKAFRGDP